MQHEKREASIELLGQLIGHPDSGKGFPNGQ
jgi:hypothetical protein